MRKTFIAIFVLLITSGYAQESTQSSGFRRGGAGNPRLKEHLKQRIVEELKLTEPQADSITIIQMEFQKSMRELKQNSNLSEEDKREKMKGIQASRKEKLKNTLTEDQLTKLDAIMEEMRNKKNVQK